MFHFLMGMLAIRVLEFLKTHQTTLLSPVFLGYANSPQKALWEKKNKLSELCLVSTSINLTYTGDTSVSYTGYHCKFDLLTVF